MRKSSFQSSHHKMFRRQFRHIYEKEENSDLFYEEIFLDQNGYSQKSLNFEADFQDTIFTTNPPESFLTEVMENDEKYPKDAIYLFISTPLFNFKESFTEAEENNFKSFCQI